VSQRERFVAVGSRLEDFRHEQVSRHTIEGVQQRQVTNAGLAEALDQRAPALLVRA
jgi:hypothetical protein